MEIRRTQNASCSLLDPDAHRQVHVVRFLRPDLRATLDDREATEDSTLYRDLHGLVLGDLAEGQTVVMNFGMIEPFTSAFYRLLLKVRETVLARKARLVLCCLTPNVQEGFDLFAGDKLFKVVPTEAIAAHEARK